MGLVGSFVGELGTHIMRYTVQLSTEDDCWRSQWLGDAVRRNHVTAKYEDTQQQICKIYAINKYTTPDGIEDKQMYYFYIILAQITKCWLRHLIMGKFTRTSS